MTKQSRIDRLRAEYLAIHDEVLSLYRNGAMTPELEATLQTREQNVVDALRSFGAEPYATKGETVRR